MTEIPNAADPIINVITQDSVPAGITDQFGDGGRAPRFDPVAMDAVSARRRREFDAARARLRDHPIRDDAQARALGPRATADAPSEKADAARVPLDQPPERVRKRYLRAGNQYFLKDAPYQLAFEDLGPYLATEHNRPDVVESMVDMVVAKSWRRIRVSGHEAFRSEVWLQGTLLGIDVRGYEPKAADLARLADARQSRLNNRIDANAPMTPAGTQIRAEEQHTPASVSAPDMDLFASANDVALAIPRRTEEPARPPDGERRPVAGDERDAPRRYAGELQEHGGAPYRNNPARSDSYYVVFRDETGTDHIVWGVDLERAVRESRAEPGQQITLEDRGRRLVTVKVPILDAQGSVVGEEEKDVHRNTWQVDVVQHERPASATRSARAPDDAVTPRRTPAREDKQERPPSTVSGEERVLHLAVLVGAMREQGFSARSIARVQQRAEQMLEAFGREDIPVPRPKVFDPKAPSERDRRARPATGRVPAREIERTPGEPSRAR